MTFDTFNQILSFAIEREQQAHDLYMMLASTCEQEQMKHTFVQFAREELGHLRKLKQVKTGRRQLPPFREQALINIERRAPDVPHDGASITDMEMDYRQVLTLAMNREKASFRLYAGLAEACEDVLLKRIFMSLAQEEAGHKLRFEVELDQLAPLTGIVAPRYHRTR